MTVSQSETENIIEGEQYIYQSIYTYNMSYDNCVHNEPLMDMMFSLNGGTVKFHHQGALSFTETMTDMYSYSPESHSMDFEVNADNLSFEVTVNDETVEKMTADLEGGFSFYESSEGERMNLHLNGSMVEQECFEDGKAHCEFTMEGRNVEIEGLMDYYNYSMSFTSNGYLGLTQREGEESETAYMETENFAANYTRGGSMPLVEPLTVVTESYSGVYGSSCLGGSVSLNTSEDWVTYSNQPDIYDVNGTTPGTGTTTIAGAGTATVNFDTNGSGNAYGTITVGGETSEPMSRPEMLEGVEECNVFYWGLFL